MKSLKKSYIALILVVVSGTFTFLSAQPKSPFTFSGEVPNKARKDIFNVSIQLRGKKFTPSGQLVEIYVYIQSDAYDEPIVQIENLTTGNIWQQQYVDQGTSSSPCSYADTLTIPYDVPHRVFMSYRWEGWWVVTPPYSYIIYGDSIVISGSGWEPKYISWQDTITVHYDIEPVSSVQASDYEDDNGIEQVRVSWEYPFERDSLEKYDFTRFKIYRNSQHEWNVTDEPYHQFDTRNPFPGKLYHYEVTADFRNWRESPRAGDYGFVRANGIIGGRIKLKLAAESGVPNVKVTALCKELSSALEFDGSEDYVSTSLNIDQSGPRSPSYTFETWVYPKSTSSGRHQVISTDDGGYEWSLLREGGTWYVFTGNNSWSTGKNVTLNEWQHLAVVFVPGTGIKFYKNRDSAVSIGTIDYDSRDDNINIGRNPGHGEYFSGIIDEVRIWNIARSESDIRSDMDRILRGDEQGLVAYWRMDEGTGEVAGDYAKNGGHHGTIFGATWHSDSLAEIKYSDSSDRRGEYSIQNIYYIGDGNKATFVVWPDTTGGHHFSPESDTVELKYSSVISDYQKSGIDFTDESSFPISGQVKFAGIPYNIEGVDILIDEGLSGQTTTDENGIFSIGVQIGDHRIEPSFYNHSFQPQDTTILVSSVVTGLLFEDTTTYSLSGKIVGGSAGYDIGEATLSITGPNDCFEEIITTDSSKYSIRLPALPDISVSIIHINGQTVEEFLTLNEGSLKASRTISLVEGDTTLDFIYYSRPKIIFEGFPEPTTVYNIPVLVQGERDTIKIRISEDYGNNQICPADSGVVTIYDEISEDAPPTEVELDSSGQFDFLFRVGMPNIIPGGEHPYQKRLQVYASTRGGERTEDQWVIVTGYRPREQTFTTVSPEVPLLILRDPPGDASYSYFEKATTTQVTASLSMLLDISTRAYLELKSGVAFSISAGGPFASVGIGYAQWGTIGASFEVGASALSQFEQQLTITNRSRFSTSADEVIIGDRGDVFVGAALNLIYAIADVLQIDDQGEVELSKSIIYGANEDEGAFKTTYIYTKEYISNSLIPELRYLRDLSFDPDSVQFYTDQIEVWEQTLAMNDSLKENAVSLEGLESSVNFSGQAKYESSAEVTLAASSTFEFNMYVDAEVAFETGLDVAGSGYKAGVQVRTRLNIGTSVTTATITNNTVGFELFDNDVIDDFWVKIKGDPVYGTPVFELQPGCKTSYPWEPGTIPHEGVRLQIDQHVQSGIDPNGQAVFKLSLINTSPTGQTRDYQLVDIPATNPDGAVILVNGIPFKDLSPYTIIANDSVKATMTVNRGPIAYDYEDLQIALKSLYDEQIADTVTFTVHFESPCSPVTLYRPEDGWLINAQSNDSLQIILIDYDKSKITQITIQYSAKDKKDWKDAFVVPVSDLPDNSALLYWNIKNVVDGAYDLRASVSWDQVQGITYSNKSSGIIDRMPPQPFGDPEPADGVLSLGDQISIRFRENIDTTSVSPQNITLINVHNGSRIPTKASSDGRTVIIAPQAEDKDIENQILQVSLVGIKDLSENTLLQPVNWSFFVNRNPVYWSPSSITKTLFQGDSTTFYAKLKNDGGEDVFFNLKNIPAWLGPDPRSGWVHKSEQKLITIYVNPNINQGYYCDTLYAETEKGNEPLHIILDVQNKPPEWTINPSAFVHNMTVTAGFYIDDVPFSEEKDIVAAFVQDTLRGMVEVRKVVPQEEYIAFLMVYSNKPRGETVDFHIWDASEGKERTIIERITFVADTSYGSAASLDSLHVSGAVLQSIALSENWTWFSLGIEAMDMSTQSVLARLQPKDGDLIKGHTSYSQYLAGIGWVGTLDTLHIGASFKINLTETRTLDFIGTPVSVTDRPIAIEPGWNWIGYLPDRILGVNEALASLNATVTEGDKLKSQFAFAEYTQVQWQGNLQSMTPGEGYMLRAAKSGMLTYPGSSGKLIHLSTIMSASALHNDVPDWSVDAAAFEHTMNVTGTLSIDGVPSTNANTFLAAFVEEDCRGLSKPVYMLDSWMYFMTIHSNKSGESIIFLVYDAGKDALREIAQVLTFKPDTILGSPSRPFAWQSGAPLKVEDNLAVTPTEFALEQNYPNPFNPSTKIRYALKQAEHVRLTVYDVLGREVKVLVDREQEAGRYQVEFDSSAFSSGIYFYRIKAGEFEQTRKMLIVK